jgi:hypothetical protein
MIISILQTNYLSAMAKSKHTISDIQKALMTHTRYIREVEKSAEPEALPQAKPAEAAKVTNENDVKIDALTLKQFRILARYLNEPAEDLINKALGHYLRLKGQQLDQAIQKLTEEVD